jgi:hypothetical protein
MKHLILVLLLIAPAAGYSQFKLTPLGFVSDVDSTKNYVVTEAPGSTQAQLYKSALLYLSSLYVSPKEVLSTIENESITVNAIATKAIKMKVLYLNPSWDVNYTVTFQFKDGKLRILQPSINRITTQTGDVYRTASVIGGSGSNHKEIYNKKGELKQKDGKQNLELMINAYVSAASKGILAAKNDNW